MKIQRSSGNFVRQPTGYSAFIPEHLPPQPPIAMGQALNVALSRADRALGRLDGSIETLPYPNMFLSMFVRREAVLSSQIEGTQASLDDIVKAEAFIKDKARPSDVREVQNYVQAIQEGVASLDTIPISSKLISRLHRTLMNEVRGYHHQPGEIRTSQNWIGPEGSSISNASFVPPPPHMIHNMLGNLEQFLHSESPIPPLIRIGIAHAQFETIHPFLDGNGRVGRLLITLFLVEKEFVRRPVLYLSYYFKKNRMEYYDRLQAIRTNGDWEGWLLFFLNGIAEVANLAAETAQKILRLRENHRQKIIDDFDRSASLPLKLIDTLYELPITSPNMAAKVIETSYPTANQILKKLEEIGIIMEITQQKRNRIYVYNRYMSLFDGI